MGVPRTQIGEIGISRLICGSNPFFGVSYRSDAHNAWQRRHFTPERIADVLGKCLEVGITAVMADYDEQRTIPQALEEVQRRCGQRPIWVACVSGEDERLRTGIGSVADDGADLCFIQGAVADRCFSYNYVGQLVLQAGDTLDRLTELVSRIHEVGLPAGMGSHRWQILKLIAERGYDVQFMVTTLNYVGVYCDYAGAVQAINTIDKPIIAIKVLGGSARVRPEDGLTCAFASIKRGDMVAVGMEHEDAAEENARLAEQTTGYLAR